MRFTSAQPAGGVSPAGRGGSVSGGRGSGTHYTAGGMPLAFTQEDFLVLNVLLCCVLTFSPTANLLEHENKELRYYFWGCPLRTLCL